MNKKALFLKKKAVAIGHCSLNRQITENNKIKILIKILRKTGNKAVRSISNSLKTSSILLFFNTNNFIYHL